MSSELEIHEVTHRYGAGGEVLRGVSLRVPASSCTALLGASGSGKSTLLRVAAGLEEPEAGQVLLDGETVTGVPAERRGMALVFQSPMLFPYLSVLDNVAFADRMAGRSKAHARRRAMEYLELVQLQDYGRRRPAELSGGQEQRVALARALARQPRILLLDEPFSSLDVRLREDMYALLADIRRRLEPTIVVVTHDRREASILADSIAVIDGGRILQHGQVADLHYRPASLAVSRLLGGLNEVPGRLIDGVHESALGRLPVPPPAEPPRDAGSVGDAEGTAFAVFRQETVRLVPTGTGNADATVTQVKSLGAHTLVTVVIGSGDSELTLFAELIGMPDLRVGERVGVAVPDDAVWAVQTNA